MKKDYFAYPTPFLTELREMYQTPYRFSKGLRDYVDYMFSHPYNKHNGVYHRLHTRWDSNDMLKRAYLIAKYYLDHPQQFGNSMDNVAPAMIVYMWRGFISMHKVVRGAEFTQYYPAKMKILTIGEGRFLDMLLDEINNNKMIMSEDDMVKRRKGVGLRERRTGYSEKALRYYESLD